MAFKIAGSMAFKEAAKNARPVLLEPIMNVEAVTPEEYMGVVIGDLNSRRGKIQNIERRDHEVHHKYPWLSHQYLKAVFEATRDGQPYLVVRGYWRSLFNLRRLRYYESPETMRRFLTTPDW